MDDARSSRPRILVVEDESLVAFLLEDMLEEIGCEVVASVGQLDQGLALAEENGFDLALLDVNLGNGNMSYPIARRLQERGIPFAFLTAYGPRGVEAYFPDAQVVQKPFLKHDLEKMLERTL